MTTKHKRSQQPSSRLDGWHAAGHVMPARLTKRQEQYARRAAGIARFTYNLCVSTHAFCRNNRLPWPSWQDLNREFNAITRYRLTVGHRRPEIDTGWRHTCMYSKTG